MSPLSLPYRIGGFGEYEALSVTSVCERMRMDIENCQIRHAFQQREKSTYYDVTIKTRHERKAAGR